MLLFENVGLREEFTIKTETSEVMVFGFAGRSGVWSNGASHSATAVAVFG
jgi:hypothetical protein